MHRMGADPCVVWPGGTCAAFSCRPASQLCSLAPALALAPAACITVSLTGTAVTYVAMEYKTHHLNFAYTSLIISQGRPSQPVC
eukprot:243832-Chlamydomonas_euryale.AAC.1